MSVEADESVEKRIVWS